jgi:AcrR family transcriptional regulator
MARVVKSPEVRRDEIVDAAGQLFAERGYERTTISEVIALAGVSKGGFYHHFASKDDLLEAYTARLAQRSVARFSDAAETPGDRSALARLNAFFARGRDLKHTDARALAAAFNPLLAPGNAALHARIYAAMSDEVAPYLASILDHGRDRGEFDVPDPLRAAEIILTLGASNRPLQAKVMYAETPKERADARRALAARLKFHGLVVDRMLKLPDGSVDLVGGGPYRGLN